MIEPFTPDKNEPSMIRPEGESDRSTEFKEKRAELVIAINDYLVDLAKKRDANQPLANGTFLSDKPRIVTTNLGRTGYNANLMSTEKIEGVSLTGDNTITPLILQAVIINPRSGDLEIFEMQGSDPVTLLISNDFNSSRQSEILGMFKVEDIKGHYFKYSLYGDGSVAQQSYAGDDFHKSRKFSDIASLELAHVAFKHITQDLNF